MVSASFSFEGLQLRLDVWNVGPALGGSLSSGDGEFLNNRHAEFAPLCSS